MRGHRVFIDNIIHVYRANFQLLQLREPFEGFFVVVLFVLFFDSATTKMFRLLTNFRT